MNERPVELSAAKRCQCAASDPRISAWVIAHAGSGKTYVLIQRLIRLMLDGSDPSKLLCLTFTKAAAATMANRILSRLSTWVRMPHRQLVAELTELNGCLPNADTIVRARCLFAEVLELLGGLRIQTIHAFCENILRRFSVEAGLHRSFEVLDEQASFELITEAKSHVLAMAWGDDQSPIWQAILTVVQEIGERGLDKALTSLIEERGSLECLLREHGSVEELLEHMRKTLLGDMDQVVPDLKGKIFACPFIERIDIPALIQRLLDGTANDIKQANRFILAVDKKSIDEDLRVQNLLSIFLTQDGKVRKNVGISKAIHDEFPSLAAEGLREAQRMIGLLDCQKASKLFELQSPLTYLGNVLVKVYKKFKADRNVLDFSDLIEKARELLYISEASTWVQYKLDQDIEHVLVDEAQDVSPSQWDIIEGITAEFFSDSIPDVKQRTVFVVGDVKQSIYSFHNAYPQDFFRRERRFRRLALRVKHVFRRIQLPYSFRSDEVILAAVDIVFGSSGNKLGVTDGAQLRHLALRTSAQGSVEIWPPLMACNSSAVPGGCKIPLYSAMSESPEWELAKKIAISVRDILRSSMVLNSTGQPVRPGDIMILVRKRGLFSEAVNRELKKVGVQVAGSDRLKLFQHIAVLDLIALGSVLLLPEDDLSFAALLKSPLIGYTDQELIWLSMMRTKCKSLYATFELCRDALNAHKIYARLELWRNWARKYGALEFYARVLGQDGGRRDFVARLGEQVTDILDEFLLAVSSHEELNGPCLSDFVERAKLSGMEIKREMDEACNEVRVMSIHGAKGLEAPVIFIVDSAGNPQHSNYDPVFLSISAPVDAHNAPKTPLMLWNIGRDKLPAVAMHALNKAQGSAMEEYYRLLYVAMTRASDRLIIACYSPKTGVHKNSWFEFINGSLSPLSEQKSDDVGACLSWVFTSRNLQRSNTYEGTMEFARSFKYLG